MRNRRVTDEIGNVYGLSGLEMAIYNYLHTPTRHTKAVLVQAIFIRKKSIDWTRPKWRYKAHTEEKQKFGTKDSQK